MFYDRVSVHASVGVDPTSDEDEPKDSLHVRLVAIAVCSTVTSHVCDVFNTVWTVAMSPLAVCVTIAAHVTLSCTSLTCQPLPRGRVW